MKHKEIYEMFKRLFPLYSSGTMKWSPRGKNSIKLGVCKGIEFIFTYNSNKEWSFETINMYEKYRKKVK